MRSLQRYGLFKTETEYSGYLVLRDEEIEETMAGKLVNVIARLRERGRERERERKRESKKERERKR